MLESIKEWLRGDYNSIRHRFLYLPREWIEYIVLYRLRDKHWVDFYAARLDRFQRNRHIEPLQESYKVQGAVHLEYLKMHGLKPSHKLLDYGCGVLRSGIFFVKYLAPGNYTGVDISQGRLEHGEALMRKEGIDTSAYRVFRVRDCLLRELDGMTFDYVFANSVLTHMPAEDICTMLAAMRPLLSPNGKFFFTYAEADSRRRRNIKDFWYSRNEIQSFCEQAGYEFRVLNDWPKEAGVMGMVSIPGSRPGRASDRLSE